jgi:hypothetical protein
MIICRPARLPWAAYMLHLMEIEEVEERGGTARVRWGSLGLKGGKHQEGAETLRGESGMEVERWMEGQKTAYR